MTAMNPEQSATLKRLLQPGEFLLWEGGPVPGIHLQPGDAAMIPISILWCCFAIFWEFTAISNGTPFFFALWGIPFLLAGLYMVVGRFFHTAWKLKQTYYGVTDTRVILMEHNGTKFLTYRQIPMLEKRVKSNGVGTIYLSEPQVYYNHGTYRRNPQNRTALLNIPDAERVYRLIETNMLQTERN